jgi:uncharacterized membrane protein YphA (DoxX/SURF4 family)
MGSGSGKLASSVSPVFLRAAIGVTFIWAGLGKLLPHVNVGPVDAAILANAGLDLPGTIRGGPTPVSAPADAPADLPDAPPPGAPALPDATPAKPAANPEAKPARKPTSRPAAPVDPEDTTVAELPQVGDVVELPSAAGTTTTPGAKVKAPETKPAPSKPAAPGKSKRATGDAPASEDDQPADKAPAKAQPAAKPEAKAAPAWPSHLPKGRFTSAQFPQGATVRRVYELSALLVRSSHPAHGLGSKPQMGLLPRALGLDPWPRYIAWVAALTELLAGIAVLVGWFTRSGAVVLGGVMLTAMWLTQIGPAVQTGQAALGFIPAVGAWWDPKAYAALLWQVSLLAGCLALAFAGSGAWSLGRFLASRPGGGGGGGKGKQVSEDEEE